MKPYSMYGICTCQQAYTSPDAHHILAFGSYLRNFTLFSWQNRLQMYPSMSSLMFLRAHFLTSAFLVVFRWYQDVFASFSVFKMQTFSADSVIAVPHCPKQGLLTSHWEKCVKVGSAHVPLQPVHERGTNSKSSKWKTGLLLKHGRNYPVKISVFPCFHAGKPTLWSLWVSTQTRNPHSMLTFGFGCVVMLATKLKHK